MLTISSFVSGVSIYRGSMFSTLTVSPENFIGSSKEGDKAEVEDGNDASDVVNEDKAKNVDEEDEVGSEGDDEDKAKNVDEEDEVGSEDDNPGKPRINRLLLTNDIDDGPKDDQRRFRYPNTYNRRR